MTIADVYDFYVRRDVGEALGTEDPCTGCDKKLQSGEAYSNYDIAGKPRTPRAVPPHLVLCQECAYMVIAWRPPKEPA
jgi:hypothetical protein